MIQLNEKYYLKFTKCPAPLSLHYNIVEGSILTDVYYEGSIIYWAPTIKIDNLLIIDDCFYDKYGVEFGRKLPNELKSIINRYLKLLIHY